MAKLKSINPSSQEVLGEIEISSKDKIIQKVKKAQNAAAEWRVLGVEGRIKILRQLSELLLKRKKELSNLAAKEMGMPINEVKDDIDYSIDYLNWYFDNAKKYLSPKVIQKDEEAKRVIYHEPRGVVAAITPWNFPVSNFIWMVIQNLIVGNTVVFKDSEEVPLFGREIEKLMNEINLPEGVFSEVYGGAEVGEFLTDQPVDMICFTGSSQVGQKIYKKAASKFIKVFLEMGGSAPGIVFADADIDKVLESIYWAKFLNCGQVCDGLKRLIVHESKFKEVVEKLKKKLESVKIGEATNEKTQMGPLVSKKQLEKLEAQVEDAVNKGAKIATGGKRPKGLKGYFYLPTLLTSINFNMRVWKEEVFGPILPIVSFKREKEAIKLANDTNYGLGSYLYSEDKEKLKSVAKQLETGMVSTNNASYLHPACPFGGRKKSGMGWQHGRYAFEELSQMKLVAYEK